MIINYKGHVFYKLFSVISNMNKYHVHLLMLIILGDFALDFVMFI